MQCLAIFRLSTSPLHRHCYSSQQDELRARPVRTRIAGQVRVRAMQAGQTRSCGGAHTHTSTRAQRRLRSAHMQLAQLPYPPAPPRPVLTLNTGAHEQYLRDPWAPGHAVLCVWKPERRSFTDSRSHARSLEVRFFRSQSESSRPYMWGVGLTQQIV
jgi:hypothetical protein